jgi:hypothetical protein
MTTTLTTLQASHDQALAARRASLESRDAARRAWVAATRALGLDPGFKRPTLVPKGATPPLIPAPKTSDLQALAEAWLAAEHDLEAKTAVLTAAALALQAAGKAAP